ncbi:hypothetical protein Leryth_004609 [Lithospermum erythrorhizon]|nr:hypothetical protein Leryth_004609 [Lithospermum erythrorhizon]
MIPVERAFGADEPILARSLEQLTTRLVYKNKRDGGSGDESLDEGLNGLFDVSGDENVNF